MIDLNLIISIISALIGAIGLYQFGLFVFDYINKPNIEIGVLPIYEIENGILELNQIGKKSTFDEFEFDKKYFAKKSNSEIPFINLKKFKKINRIIKRLPNNEIEIPIIIYNTGNNDAKNYKLMISFSEWKGSSEDTRISIIDVKSETAKINGLYVENEVYKGTDNRDKIPDKRIVEIYKKCDLSANFVSFNGNLGSGTFEMILLKLSIPEDKNSFAIYYEVDLDKNYKTMNRYCQLISIEN